MFEGMKLPTYREGDTVQPGRTVAEVVDLSEMEIKAKVSETERASITAGAPANDHARGAAGRAADRRNRKASAASRRTPSGSRRRRSSS